MLHPVELLCFSSLVKHVEDKYASPLCQMLRMLRNIITVNNIYSLPVVWYISLLWIQMFIFSQRCELLLLLDFSVENFPRESIKPNTHMLEQLVKYGLHNLIIKHLKEELQIKQNSVSVLPLSLPSYLCRNKISDKPDFDKESLEEI